MKSISRRPCFSAPLALRAKVAWLPPLLALAVSGAANGDGSPSPPPTTTTRVTIDIRAQSVNGTLPFDVPFAMTGDVPQGVDVVRVLYRECLGAGCAPITRGAACTSFSPAKDKDNEQWKPAASRPLIWQRDPVLQTLKPDQAAFVINVPDLKASSRYQFVFDLSGRVGSDEAAAFRLRAHGAVSAILAKLKDSNHTDEFFRHLRAELRTALEGAAGSGACVVTGGTILEEKSGRALAFEEKVRPVIDVKVQRLQDIQIFNSAASDLGIKLDELRRSPVRALIAGLLANKELAPTVAIHDRAVKLAGLEPSALRSLVRGAPLANPNTAMPEFGLDEPPARASDRSAALDETKGVLGDLRAWLLDLSQFKVLDRLVKDSVLTSSEADSVRALTKPRTDGGALDSAFGLAFSAAGAARTYAADVVEEQREVDEIADTAREEARSITILATSTIGDFKTSSAFYLSADAGFAFAPGLNKTVPYLGTNIYFRPVNKDAPLRLHGGWGRRLCFTIALTLTGIADSTRDDLFHTQSLLLGGGIRITDSLRLGGGAILFERKDPNPLVDHNRLATSPYLSLSFDWDVAKQLAGFGKLFAGS